MIIRRSRDAITLYRSVRQITLASQLFHPLYLPPLPVPITQLPDDVYSCGFFNCSLKMSHSVPPILPGAWGKSWTVNITIVNTCYISRANVKGETAGGYNVNLWLVHSELVQL